MSHEPNLEDFIRMIGRRWLWLVIPVLVSVLLALVWLRMTPPHYTAVMTVGPTASDGVAGRGTRLTLRSVEQDFSRQAPVEMDEDESLSDFARFLELLRSSEVAQSVIQDDDDFLPLLFPAEWNETTKTWHPPKGIGNRIKHLVYRLSGHPGWTPPDAGRMADVLRQDIVIEPIGTSAMRRVRFRHPKRAFAINVLNALHQHADEHLRSQARHRTAQEIDYIRQNMQSITLAEHRRALSDLLATQEQTQMMINVDLPFAADRIEAAYALTTPDWPSPFIVLLVALGAGFMIGVILVYYRETAR